MPKYVNKFVTALSKLEDGERAKLKRNAGQTLNDSRDVMGLFYNKLLRDIRVSDWEEETYFLVATLYPFDKRRSQPPETGEKNPPADETTNEKKAIPSFGKSLRSIRTEKNSSGLDRRVERLLDADAHQLTFYLRREVHFVTNEGGFINWVQLLDDLLHWGNADRYIQRRWARDYFTSQPVN